MSIQFITVEPLVQSIEAPHLAMRKAMLLHQTIYMISIG